MLFFKPNSAELEDTSYMVLRQVSDFLSANPNSEVTLATYSTQEERPGLSSKLLELRETSIRTVLAAQPKIKGAITVINQDVRRIAEDRDLPAGGFSKPLAEIRIRPGAKSQVVD